MAVGNPADAGDVKLERPLTPDEIAIIPTWLKRAWRILQDESPGIAQRMDTDPPQDPAPPGTVARETVAEVVIAMVERKLRNPEGLRAYNVDDSTMTIDQVMSSGQLAPTAAELARLAPPVARSGGIYSLQLGR